MPNKSILLLICFIAFESATANNKYDYIKTNSGKEFKDFIILGQDPSSIKIEHEFGTARIKFEDLPDDWKTKFNYDYESSKKHEEKRNDLIREKNKKDKIDADLAKNSIKIKGRVLQKLETGLLIVNAKVLEKQMVVRTNNTHTTDIWEKSGVKKDLSHSTALDYVEYNFSNGLAFIESKSEITDKLYENSECLFETAWQVGQYEYISKSGEIQVVPKLCVTRDEAIPYLK
jgi:hypothetical protein